MKESSQLNFTGIDPEEMLSAQNNSWDKSIIDLRGYFQIKTYTKKSTIYSFGDTLKEIHILKQGRVRLTRPLNQLKANIAHVVTDILPAGELFGNMSFESDYRAEESAITAEDAEVWSIAAQELSELMSARPELAIELFRIQSNRLEQQARRKHWLTTKDVPARLAATLVELADTFGNPAPNRPDIHLTGITQQDLADLVGASRSFVSTLINMMKQDGYLFSIGRNICIPSKERLSSLAGDMSTCRKLDPTSGGLPEFC